MTQYKTTSSDGKFLFLLDCCEREGGWELSRVEIMQGETVVLPGRALAGSFSAHAVAIAHAINWCETIVEHLTTKEVGPRA